MSEEQKEEIKSYYLQIILLFIVLIAIAIAFTYLRDLISRSKYGYPSKGQLYRKNLLFSYIFVALSFGYVLISLKNYMKKRNNETYLALIESIFLTIASLLRIYNITKNQERI